MSPLCTPRSAQTSQKLRRALEKASLLDGEGKLADDPRRTNWRNAVRGAAGLSDVLPGIKPGQADTLQADESAVAEVLNMAYSAHEITADYMQETFSWIESKGASLTPSTSPAEL